MRPTHTNESVIQDIYGVVNMDASGLGSVRVGMSTTGEYPTMVWRLEWYEDISREVVSDKNPKGSITSSDLDMAAILIQWLVLESIGITCHCSALAISNNTP